MKQPDDIFSQMLPFWEHLTPQEQMALREASVPSTLPKGTITHRADQDCKGILLLLSGQLRAFLLSEEGREVTLYRVREGETCVLSSSCLMDAIVFDVLIEAIEETHVITLPVTALSPLAQQRPEIELFLYKTASERFSDIMWTMQQILFMGMDRRAAIFLWDESAQKGPVLRITHDEMARYIGSEQRMNSSLVEYVNGIQVIKAFGRTASSYGGFSTAVAEYHDSTLAWFKQSWVWMAAVKSVVPCTLLVSLPLGVWLMSAGQLTLPIFLTCIVIPLGFIAPLLKFAQAGGQISRMDVCLNVIWDFLGTPELVRPAERVRLDGESFAFENVSFSYHEGAEVLHGVSFETHPGQITAIVGPSGSGKSTVAKLMAGFWDATDGRVAFDGVDVRNIPYQQLMEHISYVAQDTFLFDRTLADNIRMGRPAASQVDVEAAARAAGCHEFISRLPQGYDTRAGEAGERLSGGEKQRIAIARAILKNAPIVILDEATAYADPENEALVERAISKLVVGKTLVTIAHRLSTVTGADQILVMDTGRIVARGTHDKLLECCPLYRRMWEQHRSSAVLRTAEPADAAASPGGTGETLADVSTTGDNDIKEAM